MPVAFPPAGLSRAEDTKHYKAPVLEDNTLRADTEGGYEFVRPRSTRTPRKTLQTGWGWLTQADVDILITFWNDNQGFEDIDWTDPVTGVAHQVRFTKPFEITYVGGKNLAGYEVVVEMKEI